ncbi:MAG: formylmethanofuran--tetrahydromethanopterin N-formyltransferase [Phycisphaeraceae bacterium]
MQIQGVQIDDTFAEAFRTWACRLIVTAVDRSWVDVAARTVTGYATSVIGCDAEAGLERYLESAETPDGRPGAALLFFSFKPEPLGKAVANRVGQCLLTCPTTAVYDGLPGVTKTDDSARLDVGKQLRFFGDGFQKSKVMARSRPSSPPGWTHMAGLVSERYWRIPVMDGEFVVSENCGAIKAIAGGNFLVCGSDQRTTLAATQRAVEAIAPLPEVITPFPGGIVRSGSKVGSRHKKLVASTNEAYCPTLRGRRGVTSRLPDAAGCVYEIVINGLNEAAIAAAMCTGIRAACVDGIAAISAGNYGGKLGKFHFHLRKVMSEAAT